MWIKSLKKICAEQDIIRLSILRVNGWLSFLYVTAMQESANCLLVPWQFVCCKNSVKCMQRGALSNKNMADSPNEQSPSSEY